MDTLIGQLNASSHQLSVVDFSGWKIRVIDTSEQGPLKTLSSMADNY